LKGYATMKKLLEEDLEIEKIGLKTYGEWAKRFRNREVKSLFSSLAVDENGHAQGITSILAQLEDSTLEAVFYCPRCGWVLNLGRNPNPGVQVVCPMCGVKSVLVEEGGDFRLRPVSP